MRQPATRAKPAPLGPAAPVTARRHLPVWLLAVLLVLVTIALYWPATQCKFVNYDDDQHVTANVQIQKGLTWESLKRAMVTPVNCIWHPVTVLSHMVDCQLFALNPWGHHLTSVLLHAVNTMLVFLFLWGLTRALWPSVLVAALFGWHPLHVESVAWVSERKDVLSGFFGLLALMAYVRYAQGRMQNPATPTTHHAPRTTHNAPRFTLHSGTFYLLSLFFLALGLMSKPMLVTWPFVMLLLDYWPLRRYEPATPNSRLSTVLRLVGEKIPFFFLVALLSVVTFGVQKGAGALAANDYLPLDARVGNALISYDRYLGKLFWPANLAAFYPHPGGWSLAKVLLAVVVVLGISVLFWAGRRRYPCLLMGWLWFCGTLVPVIQIVQTGGHAMADRYMYLPALGGLILVTWGMCELTRAWRFQTLALAVAGGVAIFACVALTRQQIGYWRDSEALFRHALEVTENNYVAHDGLGTVLDKKGQIDEAIRQYQEAIRLKPGYADAHNNLGAVLDKKGQTDQALRQYQEAIRLKPDHADAHYNLGIAFDKKSQIDEAIRQYQEAIRLKPDHADAHYNLGIAFDKKGQIDEALSQFQEAIHVRPDHAEARNNLGIAFDKKGQIDEAIRQYQEAIRLTPDYADAHYNLGIAFDKKGQIDEAIRQYQEAIRLKPDHAEAHNNLGTTLYQQGRTGESIQQFQEALRLRPDYTDARRNLDVVLAAKARASPQPSAPSNR